MNIQCRDIAGYIESFAPCGLAEEWDNVGLLLGSNGQEVKSVLICLDVTSRVAEEAVEKKVDLIVSHHPLIFKGIKRFSPEDPKGSILYKLMKNDIAVYSAHTNLDVAQEGVNACLAQLLGLQNIANLKEYRAEKLYKVVVFVPEENTDGVRTAMSSAGAGWIGNYSDCTFAVKGLGTFRPLEGTNPYIGSKGKLETVEECRLETIVPRDGLSAVLDSMIKAHPYEEVAYDVYPLELKGKQLGLGKIGELQAPLHVEDFIAGLKKALNVDNIRLIGAADRTVKRVAVFCGSFDEDIAAVIRQRADMLVTGDIKYHTAVDMAEAGLCAVDAGHFSTERIMVPAMVKKLAEKFQEISVTASQVEKDPFKTY